MRLYEGEHADGGSLPGGGYFQRFKSRTSTVLCTGNLKGVQLVHLDVHVRAVAMACHTRRVETLRHRYVKPEYLNNIHITYM